MFTGPSPSYFVPFSFLTQTCIESLLDARPWAVCQSYNGEKSWRGACGQVDHGLVLGVGGLRVWGADLRKTRDHERQHQTTTLEGAA